MHAVDRAEAVVCGVDGLALAPNGEVGRELSRCGNCVNTVDTIELEPYGRHRGTENPASPPVLRRPGRTRRLQRARAGTPNRTQGASSAPSLPPCRPLHLFRLSRSKPPTPAPLWSGLQRPVLPRLLGPAPKPRRGRFGSRHPAPAGSLHPGDGPGPRLILRAESSRKQVELLQLHKGGITVAAFPPLVSMNGIPYEVTVLLFRWRYPLQTLRTRFLLSSSKHPRRAGPLLLLERLHSILAGRAHQLPNNTSRRSRKRGDLPALQEAQGRFE
jgi:hypothetical protein